MFNTFRLFIDNKLKAIKYDKKFLKVTNVKRLK